MASDVVAEYDQLLTNQSSALAAWQVELAKETPDLYVKLQYRTATDALDKFRAFWRGVDASIFMDDPDYGFARGSIRGRRGGELVQVEGPLPEPEGE